MMQIQDDPQPQPTGNPGVAWFRALVWIMPTGLVWGGFILLHCVNAAFVKTGMVKHPLHSATLPSVIWILASVIGTIYLGYLNDRLNYQLEANPLVDKRPVRKSQVAAFFFIQIAIIPVLSFWLITMIATAAYALDI